MAADGVGKTQIDRRPRADVSCGCAGDITIVIREVHQRGRTHRAVLEIERAAQAQIDRIVLRADELSQRQVRDPRACRFLLCS